MIRKMKEEDLHYARYQEVKKKCILTKWQFYLRDRAKVLEGNY